MAPAANSILPPGNRRVNGSTGKRASAIIRTKLSKIEQGAFFAKILLTFLLPAIALAADKPAPAPRFDPWTIIGPGGGGTMIAPTISPHDPRIVVEHCDMTGAYITLDGARSWRMFNLRSVVNVLAFDPRNPKVIYAGNEALWRSEDTGRTWSMVFPDPGKNTIEHQNGDHAEYSLTTDDGELSGRPDDFGDCGRRRRRTRESGSHSAHGVEPTLRCSTFLRIAAPPGSGSGTSRASGFWSWKPSRMHCS